MKIPSFYQSYYISTIRCLFLLMLPAVSHTTVLSKPSTLEVSKSALSQMSRAVINSDSPVLSKTTQITTEINEEGTMSLKSSSVATEDGAIATVDSITQNSVRDEVNGSEINFNDELVLNSTSGNNPYTPEMSSHPSDVYTPWTHTILDESEFWQQISEAYFQKCEKSCTKPLKKSNGRCRPCFCDDECFKFGDCCPDKYVKANHGPDMDTLSSRVRCLNASIETDSRHSFLFVSKCPEGETNRMLANQCLSDAISLRSFTQPVTDATTRVTYKNIYCAKCHRVVNAVLWDMQVVVTDASSIVTLTSPQDVFDAAERGDENEIVYKSPESLSPEVCKYRPVISRCNETGEWTWRDPMIERACDSFRAVVSDRNKDYKNPFCLLCNSNYTWNQLLNLESKPSRFDGSSLLNVLLEFSETEWTDEDLMAINAQCGTEQFYDMYLDRCRDVFCALGKKRKSSNDVTCHSSARRTNMYAYQFCLQTHVPPGHFRAMENANVSEDTLFSLNEVFYSVGLEIWTVEIQEVYSAVNASIERETFLILLTYMAPVPVDRDGLDNHLLASISEYILKFQRIFSTSDLQLSVTCSDDILGRHNVSMTTEWPLSFYAFNSNHELKDAKDGTTKIVHIPVTEELLCAAVQLDSHEFVFDPATGNVTLLRTGEEVSSPFAYVISDNAALLCLEKYQHWEKLDGNVALRVVSLAATILSLIFLVVSFAIYCVLPTLRSIPGMNNMILIFLLFWAQVLLEVGYGANMSNCLCQAVGVATHFLWLCVLFAQNVCTFHMFYTLSFPLESHVATLSPVAMIRKYVLYIVLNSLAFVVITLAWQSSQHGDSGYGGKFCYLLRSSARIAMFAIPLGVTVLANVAMFVITLVRIRRLQSTMSLRRSDSVSILHYTKLSCLTGVTWLLGLLASFVDWEPLDYLFGILQGSQGLFVFLAFLANRRVLTMVLERLRQDTSDIKCHMISTHIASNSVKSTTLSSLSDR